MPDLIPAEAQTTECRQRMARFPYGYHIWAGADSEDGMWRAILGDLNGGNRVWRGELFSDSIDAMASSIPAARAMMAARIRELRRLPNLPKFPRMCKRQAWRFQQGVE